MKHTCKKCKSIFGIETMASYYYIGVLTGKPVYMCTPHAEMAIKDNKNLDIKEINITERD